VAGFSLWNPVKELKFEADFPAIVRRLGVESGEGIEIQMIAQYLPIS